MQVRAWKALKDPGPEFKEILDPASDKYDPNYREVYCRQVEISRTLMMCTVIARTKIV